ncbi:GFA family protein [Streptomyces globisporus]|uniref:GFA family protein n=1 Tax=Streptomyces globisporus TaxID=1908 RepID=UPI00099BECF6|nr:GFA family protein [Streptomyces globisporus]
MTSTPASSTAFPSPPDEPLPAPAPADAPTGAIRTGHCLCGHLAYRVAGDPFDPHLCSCPHETRISGGPAVLWVGFPTESLSWTGPGGEPKWYSTYPTLRRGFCSHCGTHLVSVAEGSDMIMVTGFSLTDQRGIEPLGHSYRESSVSWMNIALAPDPAGPTLRPRSS